MTSNQRMVLMKEFKTNPYLKNEQIHQLATSLNVSARRIENWFCYWRFRQRQKGLLVKGDYSKTKLKISIYSLNSMWVMP